VGKDIEPTGKAIGLDMGLKFAYVNNIGHGECQGAFFKQM
jgi:putative transposase